MDYEAFLSKSARRRCPHKLRSMHKYVAEGPDDLINLTGGLPNSSTFPLKAITITLMDGSEVTLSEAEMVSAQQYWPGPGLAVYRELLLKLVKRLHNPPCWDNGTSDGRTAVHPTAGGTDGYHQVFSAILDEGDNILMAEFNYPGIITSLKGFGVTPITLAMDEYGIMPDSLQQALSRWDPAATPGSTDKPKLLYVIPCGQNPTGATYTLERKQQIYQIAQEYNILIYEDDPYWHVVFNEPVASFLALDTDGRVLRSDTFAKTLAPGFRGGYLSGPEYLMRKIEYHIACSSYGTCALTQVITVAIFNKLGIDGFLQTTQRSRDFYLKQRNLMKQSIDKWLADLVEYRVPQSGMFFWLKIKGVTGTKQLMLEHGLHAGILVCPAEFFSPTEEDGPYIRVTYSVHSAEVFDEACQRLGHVIRSHLSDTPVTAK